MFLAFESIKKQFLPSIGLWRLNVLLWIAVGCALGGCSSTSRPVEKGKAVFVGQDFEDKPIELEGNWEFYWKILLTPDDFHKNSDFPLEPRFEKVPASWTTYSPSWEGPIPAFGFATYRIMVQVPDSISRPMGLYIPKMWCSAIVWANGEHVYSVGKVGKTRFEYENKMLEKIVEVEPENGKLELIVQVSNYSLFVGGMLENFKIGYLDVVQEEQSLQSNIQVLWLGGILLMGLYHLVLFVYRKKERATLWVGTICFLVAARFIVFGNHEIYEYLRQHWGGLTFELQSRVYYVATFFLAPIGLAYVHRLYPNVTKGRRLGIQFNDVVVFFTLASAVYSVMFVFLQSILFPTIEVFFPVLVVVPSILIVVVLFIAAFGKQKGTALQIFGISVMLITGMNDFLHTQGVQLLGGSELLAHGFFIFLSIQFIVLARKFSGAFSEVEELSGNLEKKVLQRTAEVMEQKEEIERQKEAIEDQNATLAHTNKHITDSIRYARRIQNALLGNTEEIIAHFKNAPGRDMFILFSPRDIVSGDFYWFAQLSVGENRYKVIVAADCTGHGVPGAFMTIMGNVLLNDIINETNILFPSDILAQLDKRIISSLNRQQGSEPSNDGMDIAIAIVDESNYRVAFAGAKNPLYCSRLESTGERSLIGIKGSAFPIGSTQYAEDKTFQTEYLDIMPGDIFYLATDGYQDQFGGPENRKMMRKHFREQLLRASHLPFADQKMVLEQVFNHWKGQRGQTDDVLLIGFKV